MHMENFHGERPNGTPRINSDVAERKEEANHGYLGVRPRGRTKKYLNAQEKKNADVQSRPRRRAASTIPERNRALISDRIRKRTAYQELSQSKKQELIKKIRKRYLNIEFSKRLDQVTKMNANAGNYTVDDTQKDMLKKLKTGSDITETETENHIDLLKRICAGEQEIDLKKPFWLYDESIYAYKKMMQFHLTLKSHVLVTCFNCQETWFQNINTAKLQYFTDEQGNKFLRCLSCKPIASKTKNSLGLPLKFSNENDMNPYINRYYREICDEEFFTSPDATTTNVPDNEIEVHISNQPEFQLKDVFDLPALTTADEQMISIVQPLMKVYNLSNGRGQRHYTGHCVALPQDLQTYIETEINTLPRHPSKLGITIMRKYRNQNQTAYRELRCNVQNQLTWLKFLTVFNPHYKNIIINENLINELQFVTDIENYVTFLNPEDVDHDEEKKTEEETNEESINNADHGPLSLERSEFIAENHIDDVTGSTFENYNNTETEEEAIYRLLEQSVEGSTPTPGADVLERRTVIGSASTGEFPVPLPIPPPPPPLQTTAAQPRIHMAPSLEHTKPISYYSDMILSKTFPCLFPTGNGDPTNHVRKEKVGLAEGINHLTKICIKKSDDTTIYPFGSHPTFTFFAQTLINRIQLATQEGVSYSKNQDAQALTREELTDLLNKSKSTDETEKTVAKNTLQKLVDNMYRYTGNITGSPSYFTNERFALQAGLEQCGGADLFFTFSAADCQWPDLHKLLPHNYENPTLKQKYAAVITNPHLVDAYCDIKIKTIVESYIKDILQAKWTWCRIEFQQRGTLHVHGCAKLKYIPEIKTLESCIYKGRQSTQKIEQLIQYIQRKLFFCLIDGSTDPNIWNLNEEYKKWCVKISTLSQFKKIEKVLRIIKDNENKVLFTLEAWQDYKLQYTKNDKLKKLSHDYSEHIINNLISKCNLDSRNLNNTTIEDPPTSNADSNSPIQTSSLPVVTTTTAVTAADLQPNSEDIPTTNLQTTFTLNEYHFSDVTTIEDPPTSDADSNSPIQTSSLPVITTTTAVTADDLQPNSEGIPTTNLQTTFTLNEHHFSDVNAATRIDLTSNETSTNLEMQLIIHFTTLFNDVKSGIEAHKKLTNWIDSISQVFVGDEKGLDCSDRESDARDLNDRFKANDSNNPHPCCTDISSIYSTKTYAEHKEEKFQEFNQIHGKIRDVCQRHLCSSKYCLKKDAKGKEHCRFCYPQELTKQTFLSFKDDHYNDEKYHVHINHQRDDRFMNPSNPLQVTNQAANVDLTIVIQQEKLTNYVTKYMTKVETSSTSATKIFDKICNDDNANVPVRILLRKAWSAMQPVPDQGAQHVAHKNLNLAFVNSPFVAIKINTDLFKHNVTLLLNTDTDIDTAPHCDDEENKNQDEGNTGAFTKSFMESYALRFLPQVWPDLKTSASQNQHFKILEDMCIYDFAMQYTYNNKKEIFDNRIFKEKTVPYIKFQPYTKLNFECIETMKLYYIQFLVRYYSWKDINDLYSKYNIQIDTSETNLKSIQYESLHESWKQEKIKFEYNVKLNVPQPYLNETQNFISKLYLKYDNQLKYYNDLKNKTTTKQQKGQHENHAVAAFINQNDDNENSDEEFEHFGEYDDINNMMALTPGNYNETLVDPNNLNNNNNDDDELNELNPDDINDDLSAELHWNSDHNWLFGDDNDNLFKYQTNENGEPTTVDFGESQINIDNCGSFLQNIIADEKQSYTDPNMLNDNYPYKNDDTEVNAMYEKMDKWQKLACDVFLNPSEYQTHSIYPEQQFVLLMGKGGTGKSFVIDYLKNKLKGKLLLLATSGVAAQNIHGSTIQSYQTGLSIPCKTKNYNLSAKALKDLQNRFLKHGWTHIICDELSMSDQLLLSLFELRCRQGNPKNQHLYFGGLHVKLTGDLGQLPPPGGMTMYNYNMSTPTSSKEGLITFRLFETVIVLKKNNRLQKINDSIDERDKMLKFQGLLDSIHKGEVTEVQYINYIATELLFPKKKEDEAIAKKFNPDSPDVLSLHATNEEAFERNNKIITSLKTPIVLVQSTNSNETARKATPNQVGMLLSRIYICTGCRIILTTNLWTEWGLVNGVEGTIVAIIYKPDELPPSLPLCVIVDIEKYTGPSIFDALKFGNKSKTWVPIAPMTIAVNKNDTTLSNSLRTMVPFRVSYAMTFHKSQGLSIKKPLLLYLPATERTANMTYTGISRTTNPDDILICGTDLTLDRFTKKITKSTLFWPRRWEESRLAALETKTILLVHYLQHHRNNIGTTTTTATTTTTTTTTPTTTATTNTLYHEIETYIKETILTNKPKYYLKEEITYDMIATNLTQSYDKYLQFLENNLPPPVKIWSCTPDHYKQPLSSFLNNMVPQYKNPTTREHVPPQAIPEPKITISSMNKEQLVKYIIEKNYSNENKETIRKNNTKAALLDIIYNHEKPRNWLIKKLNTSNNQGLNVILKKLSYEELLKSYTDQNPPIILENIPIINIDEDENVTVPVQRRSPAPTLTAVPAVPTKDVQPNSFSDSIIFHEETKQTAKRRNEILSPSSPTDETNTKRNKYIQSISNPERIQTTTTINRSIVTSNGSTSIATTNAKRQATSDTIGTRQDPNVNLINRFDREATPHQQSHVTGLLEIAKTFIPADDDEVKEVDESEK